MLDLGMAYLFDESVTGVMTKHTSGWALAPQHRPSMLTLALG